MTRSQRKKQIYIRTTLLLLGVIAILVAIFFLVNVGDKKKVDLGASTLVVVTGYEGSALITATVEPLVGYEKFFETVEVTFSKSSELKNGDKIDISLEYDKGLADSYNLRIVAKDMQFVIDGLGTKPNDE